MLLQDSQERFPKLSKNRCCIKSKLLRGNTREHPANITMQRGYCFRNHNLVREHDCLTFWGLALLKGKLLVALGLRYTNSFLVFLASNGHFWIIK